MAHSASHRTTTLHHHDALPADSAVPSDGAPAGSVAAEARSGAARLTVDLGAIAANWRLLAARLPRSECAAAVKADAYGTGLVEVAPTLAAAGCRTFFVAHLSEGQRLRALLPRARIFVLNGLVPGACADYAAGRLKPVLGSLEEIAEWRAYEQTTGWSGGAALQIDTGMNRLGIAPAAALSLAQAEKPVAFDLVMSHLACADTPDHPLNARQLEAFRALRAAFAGSPASLANSAGMFLADDLGFDLARPGIALYGANPVPGRANPMHCAVRLEAPILALRDVAAGETVGYGATWTAKRASRLAAIPLGYADGLLRAASGHDEADGAAVAVAGRRCPIAGRISMDLSMIDVTDLPEGLARRGAAVEIIGDTITLDELAERAGTVGYELLTRLGARFDRRVIG